MANFGKKLLLQVKPRLLLYILLFGFLFLIVGEILPLPNFTSTFVAYNDIKWLIQAGDSKAKILAQPVIPNEQLRHMEWYGWGFSGQETPVFLVFDRLDTLSESAAIHGPAKIPGMLCQVNYVQQLEKNWYAVLMYTNQFWDQCS